MPPHRDNRSVQRHRINRLLAALEPEDFTYLEPHLEVVNLPKGTVLYEPGQTICSTYFPHDAVVSLVEVMEDGRSAEVGMFGRESLCGLVSAVVTGEAFGRYVVHIPGTASRIAVERMQEAITARPNIRRMALRFTEVLFAQTLQTVACNAIHSVEERCCRWILSIRDRMDQDAVPLTHEFLAEILGVQRSTVSTILRPLQTAGLIIQHRGGIEVVDRAGLERATCECYRKIRARFEKLLPGTYT